MRQITGPGQRPRELELRRPDSPPMPIASVASNDSTAGNFSHMATLTIRNLDDAVRDRLRQRAAERGHSMEEEPPPGGKAV